MLWTVVAVGAPVKADSDTDSVDVTVTVESGVGCGDTPSVSPAVTDSVVPDPPGAGVAALRGSTFVGVLVTAEASPSSVAA